MTGKLRYFCESCYDIVCIFGTDRASKRNKMTIRTSPSPADDDSPTLLKTRTMMINNIII